MPFLRALEIMKEASKCLGKCPLLFAGAQMRLGATGPGSGGATRRKFLSGKSPWLVESSPIIGEVGLE